MATNFKAPPAMRDDLPYSEWKKELKIWCDFTDVDKKKQGGALFLTLSGKARQSVLSEIDTDKLATDNGIQLITNADPVCLSHNFINCKSKTYCSIILLFT